VIVLGRVLHNWDLGIKQMLLNKAYEALPVKGALIVYERLIDDDRRNNAAALLSSLNMLLMMSRAFEDRSVHGCGREITGRSHGSFSCPTREKTFSMHELVRSLNANERSKNGTLSHLYDRIGARAVKARATKSEGCIWRGSEHRWCDGNVPRLDQ
jgi:hypothetical protein